MKRLRKLARLQPSERALLFRAFLMVATIRLTLWLLPFSVLRRIVERRPASMAVPAQTNAERLAWAVRTVSRTIPAATCLTQSLALHWLLTCSGYASRVHIGVAKDSQARFEAHAWVEHQGQALLSGPSELVRYSRLLALEGSQG